MTNFTSVEFVNLWSMVADIVKTRWNVGGGRQSKVHPMDDFLMSVAHAKFGRGYARTAMAFQIPTEQFCCVVEGVISKCAAPMFDLFLDNRTISQYHKDGIQFANNKDALEAIDMTFQKLFARGEDCMAKKFGSLASTKYTA